MSKLVVSEPWDFNGPSGNNELLGRVIRRVDSKNLIFEADKEVRVNGATGRYWLLSARYKDQLFEGEPYLGVVNGSLLPVYPCGEMDLCRFAQNSIFMVIASLHDGGK